jgi:glycosyltransferase involved in cell wall biosynthesis
LAWHEVDPRVKVIEFRRNFGQTAGISAGFDYAAGRVVVVMDGDQQNDPADIPILLAALEQGHDVASGWRADRKDKFISRRLPSKVANALISRVTGLELHDYGCTLKAYDKEVIEHLELFGELHRFIPALALISGANVIEIPVNHRARERGSSKYGISRMPRVVLDLLTVKFLIGYRQKPMQFFGRVAFVCVGAAGISALWSGSRMLKKAPHQSGVATIFALASLQFASFGLIGELLTRVYFKDAAHRPYVVRSTTNSAADAG